MSRFCGGDINFSVEFDELIKALAGRRKTNLQWKWLHDQLLFWKQEMTNSTLYEEREISVLVPILVPYLCQIFRSWVTDCCKMFLRCIGKDTKWRYELFRDFQWKCLLIEPEEDKVGHNEEEELKEDESNAELCSNSTNMSLGLTHPEEYKIFFIKYQYILDLLFPSNLQYTIFRYAFSSSETFSNYELTSPFPLFLPKQYYAQNNDNTENSKRGKKGKEEQPKKKEKKLQLPESPLVVKETKPEESDKIYQKILPLKMANDVNSEFWKDLEEKIASEKLEEPVKVKQSKGKEKEEEKQKPQVVEKEDNTKDKKKEKKKGKK